MLNSTQQPALDSFFTHMSTIGDPSALSGFALNRATRQRLLELGPQVFTAQIDRLQREFDETGSLSIIDRPILSFQPSSTQSHLIEVECFSSKTAYLEWELFEFYFNRRVFRTFDSPPSGYVMIDSTETQPPSLRPVTYTQEVGNRAPPLDVFEPIYDYLYTSPIDYTERVEYNLRTRESRVLNQPQRRFDDVSAHHRLSTYLHWPEDAQYPELISRDLDYRVPVIVGLTIDRWDVAVLRTLNFSGINRVQLLSRGAGEYLVRRIQAAAQLTGSTWQLPPNRELYVSAINEHYMLADCYNSYQGIIAELDNLQLVPLAQSKARFQSALRQFQAFGVYVLSQLEAYTRQHEQIIESGLDDLDQLLLN